MTKPVVVHRPEPPAEDAPARPTAPRYTREEVQALLAVTKVVTPPWKRAARRGLVAALPTLVLSFVLDELIGWWSIPVLAVLSIAWIVRPLVGQARDGWV